MLGAHSRLRVAVPVTVFVQGPVSLAYRSYIRKLPASTSKRKEATYNKTLRPSGDNVIVFFCPPPGEVVKPPLRKRRQTLGLA